MDIKASDLTWAKVNFSDSDDALQTLEAVEKEIKFIKAMVDNPEVLTSESLEARLENLQELEEELCDVLFQDQFDLL